MSTSRRRLLTAGVVVLLSMASALPVVSVAAASGQGATRTRVHHHRANARVRAAQERLNRAGYRLRADGLMGRHTRAAIRAFQRKHRLKVTGTLDRATLRRLGL